MIYLFLAPNYDAFSHVHFNDFLKLLNFLDFEITIYCNYLHLGKNFELESNLTWFPLFA